MKTPPLRATLLAACSMALCALAQDSPPQLTPQQRMELVRSNMQAVVQAQRARAQTNRTPVAPMVLFSNENSFVVTTPRIIKHQINTNFFLTHPEDVARARQILIDFTKNDPHPEITSNTLRVIDSLTNLINTNR